MQPIEAVIAAAGLLVAGSLFTALTSRRRELCSYLALGFVAGASALSLWAGMVALVGPGDGAGEASLAGVSALGASLSLGVDRLSGLFLVIVSVVAVLSTLYSTGYMRRYPQENLVRYYPILLLFFAGIIGVVTIRDWLFFFVAWEFMTVCSYFLVIFEEDNPVALRAGLKYLIVTHAATVCMFVAAIVLWHTAAPRSFSFASSAQAMAALAQSRPAILHALLALWFIGFATKAGILPFGDWLPDAYPAAPSSASAAFAGTMTKLGVYGLLRIFVDLLPASQFSEIWGVLIALFGTGSIFVGTLTALQQDDAKRMMSFHVIGQIGYMLLGIGMGVYFLPNNPKLALVALAAGVFHLVNHVTYKSLLFLTAGALEYRAGTRDMSRLGALSSVLPLTSLAAGVGALSIAGIPPLNGFASKWLIYQVSIIGGLGLPLLLLFLILGLTAIFISLVTLASFLKYLGATFLGQPSAHVSHLIGERREVPAQMQVPQAVLAVCCVAFGLFPLLPLSAIFRAIGPLSNSLANVNAANALGNSAFGLTFTANGAVAGVWSPVLSTIALVVCIGLCYGLSRAAQAASRRVPVWYGGEEVAVEVGHFHAHGLYEPFRRAFARVYVVTGLPRAAYPVSLAALFDLDCWLYRPLVRAGEAVSQRVSRSHVGIPQWYLMWQVVGVVIVLTTLFLVLR
ncbi:MAG: proton-conducting transporter membrane subunit [Armatimonadota bacterium]